MKTNHCKCGKTATNLTMIQGYSLFLGAKHTRVLERLFGEKLEPLTRNYYEISNWN